MSDFDISSDVELTLEEAVERLRVILTDCATGNGADESEYKRLRSRVLTDTIIADKVPRFVKTCRTLKDFWSFIKPRFSKYDQRRSFLLEEFSPILTFLEERDIAISAIANSDNYEIGARIGGGGFGEVFRYRHKLIDIDFAIKLLNPSFASEDERNKYAQRFFREAKILFELDHPNIVRIYDIGVLNGKPFIRMEMLDGNTLNEILRNNSVLDFAQSLFIIRQIVDGIGYAHMKGIIHRDLKLSNLVYNPKTKLLKIIDFGISAYIESEQHSRLTRTGEGIAGGDCSDPEFETNPSMKDIRSDIYSIGAVWYSLLIGRSPRGSDVSVAMMHFSDMTEDKANIILRCLRTHKEDRFRDCIELLAEINRVCDG